MWRSAMTTTSSSGILFRRRLVDRPHELHACRRNKNLEVDNRFAGGHEAQPEICNVGHVSNLLCDHHTLLKTKVDTKARTGTSRNIFNAGDGRKLTRQTRWKITHYDSEACARTRLLQPSPPPVEVHIDAESGLAIYNETRFQIFSICPHLAETGRGKTTENREEPHASNNNGLITPPLVGGN